MAYSEATSLLREYRVDTDLDGVATEFNLAFQDAVSDIDGIENIGDLSEVTDDWGPVVRELYELETGEDGTEIDTATAVDRIAFETEEDAIESITEAIVAVSDYDFESDPRAQRELKQAVAKAYHVAVDDFLDRISGTELADDLLEEANIEELERLDEVTTRLQRLERKFQTPQYYDWIDTRSFGVDGLVESLAPRNLDFVPRPELDDIEDPHRLLVLGPGGSGKSRMLGELVERHAEEVAHVVRPQGEFKDQEHLKRLRRERFEGDVLLVWDDVHAINPESDNTIFRKTVTELSAAIPEDATLRVFAAARREELDAVPGDPTKQASKDGLWDGFDTLELEPLPTLVIAGIFRKALAEFEVEATDDVAQTFLQKAVETDPSPLYVTSVVETAGEELTEEDVAELPESALEIWEDQYEDIRSADDDGRLVLLWAFKLLEDVGIPTYKSLLEGVYVEVLGGDKTTFLRRLDGLEERQWFFEVDAESEGPTRYVMHDVKVAAIDLDIDEWVIELSSFAFDELSPKYLPDTDGVERQCHGQLGLWLKNAAVRQANQLAERHFTHILDDIDPEDEVTELNYALLLEEELGRPEDAERHFQQAIDADPQYAEAHYNYALLLEEELGRPEDAEHHYQQAIDADPALAEAHFNYAVLLEEELGRPEDAEHHYQQAIGIDPQYAEAHLNFAVLLQQDLGRPEEAEDHYQQAIDADPQYAKAHFNYGFLLMNELDRPTDARKHFEQSVTLWLEDGEVTDAIDALRLLVLVCRRLGDDEAVVNHCEKALDIPAEHDSDDPEARLYFRSMQVLSDSDADSAETYELALSNVLDMNARLAMELFERVWEQHGDYEETDPRSRVTAAGVALAAHLELFDFDSAFESDGILSTVASRERFHPESVLFQRLTGEKPSEGPNELRTKTEEYAEEGREFDAVESGAFAILLDELEP